MQYEQLVSLVKNYIKHSGIEINDLTFKNKLKRYDKPEILTIEDFMSYVTTIGNANDFVFKYQLVDKNELNNLLGEIAFPLIVFEKQLTLTPSLILPDIDKKKNAAGVLKRFDENVNIRIEGDSNSFVNTICDINHARLHSLMKMDSKNANENLFIVVSGFPLPTIVSSSTKHLTPIKRVFHLIKSEKKDISHIYFYAIMMGLVNLSLPLGIQAIIGLISGGLLINSVVILMALVVAATLISGWLQILQLSIVEILQQRLFAKAAFEFTYRIPRLNIESLGKQYAPELMNRFFDVLTIQKSLPKILIDVSTSGIQILFGLILLAFYHPLFIFFGLLLTIVIGIVFYKTGESAIETDIQTSKYKYKVASWMEELARSLNTFKLAGNTSPLPMDKLDFLVSNYLKYRKIHFKVLVVQFRAIIAFKVFITAGLLLLGSFLVVNSQISLGQFVAAEVIILLVISSVEKLLSTLESIYDLITAADKVGHVTDLDLEKNDGIILPDSKHAFSLSVSNVSYMYEGNKKHALSDINFTINQKEKVCVTGFNGSGKTTFAKVISGLLSNYSGQVLVNGIPLKEVNLDYYRKLVADNLSDQELFEGTIEENITLGKPYELVEILDAISKAGLSGYVNSLEKGMLTNLLANGSILSKSVKQKILIARSFIQHPQLLLIDEFFYNSEKSEKQLLIDQLFDKNNDWAIFFISTDPAIMKLCDRVLFMEDGKIISEGTYEELKIKHLLEPIL